MIKVKAFKESQPASQPTREDYDLQDEKDGKAKFIPLGFLVFLTGVAAYLKSCMPVRLDSPSSERSAKRYPDDGADQGSPARDAADLGSDVQDDVNTGSVEHTKKSSDNVAATTARSTLSLQVINNVMSSDSPPLDLGALRRSLFSRPDTDSIGDQGRANNDNQSGRHNPGSSFPTNGGGGGGGGSGGSSGSGSGGPNTNPPGGSNPNPPNGGSSGSGSGGSNTNPPGGSNPDPARNRAPRSNGPVHLQDMVACHAYLITVLALLAGTTDPDGDQLTLANLSASSGTVTPAEGGGWMFTPDPGMLLGDVTLTYAISDGAESVQQVAYFSIVEAPPIIGTDSDDNLLGTHCADTIDGRGGDDNIDAREGNDVVIGGDGDDHIIGGAGDDVIYAGAGDDIVFAGAGNDIVFGGAGDDRLFGEDGNDIMYGDDGDDLIVGGAGADILFAGSGDDTVYGDAGNDTLDGGAGNDTLYGGAGQDVILARAGSDVVFGGDGNDVLSDGEGADAVHGGAGNDHVIAATDATSDTHAGDDGQDTLDYSSAAQNIVVDVGRGTAQGLDIGSDLISGFETVISGRGNDHIIAGSTPISMTGGEGDDTFEFTRADNDHEPDLVRKITDFTVGDRIIAANCEIREDDSGNETGDLFDDIYLLEDGGDYRPIRFRFERIDNDDRTVVDVHDSIDPDDFYSIELNGHHHLQFTVGVA